MELTGKFEIISVHQKTRANGWKKLKPGDIITISLPISMNSSFGSSVYKVNISINLKQYLLDDIKKQLNYEEK